MTKLACILAAVLGLLCCVSSTAGTGTQAGIDSLMRPYTGDVPGASVLVIQDGKPVFRKAYGLADLEGRMKATPATNYRLASVTKQFTASAILLLAQDGRLSLNDPIRKWLPSLPEATASITLRHVLTHTSGLIDYEEVMPANTSLQLHDADVLKLLETTNRTYFAPGSAYRYSNSGYALLALVVGRASGTDFATFLRERIFKPLGMQHTVAYEEGVSAVSTRAYGYSPTGSAWKRTDQSLTSAVLGDGGIYSSTDDLAKWDAALYDQRLLNAESLRSAFTPATPTDDPEVQYGFGWRITGETLWHSGETIGFRNVLVRLPKRRTTVIVLTNRDGPEPYSTALAIAKHFVPDADVGRASSAASGPSPNAHPLNSGIRPDAIKAHMAFLADDLLEGREAGTRGYDLAANYVASQYALLGLQPAGTGNSYFQNVSLKSSRLVPDSVHATIKSQSGTHSVTNVNGIAVYSNPLEADQSLDASLVFVGYGIVAPELRIDDYKGLDVKGKLVVVIGGPPPFMPSEAAAHHGSTSQRRKVASDHGAIGVLFLYTQPMEKQFAFERLKQIVNEVDVAWIAPDGAVNVPAPGIRASVLVHLDAARYLFEGAPKTLQRVLQESRRASPKGFPLAATFSLSRKSVHNTVTSANVAALLPGSDPALANEVVLLTGHLDHVGLDPSLSGDKIYNGALDNSIGVSMMLEVARALSTAPSRPRRSVMFLAVTAEEKGLIGSDYFAHFPTVPMSRIVANVNLDGAVPFYDFTDVIAFGAEHSTLGEIVAGAVQSAGLAQSPDPFPEEGFFVRSDHYSFVKQGVPAVMLFTGMGTGADGKSGREAWDGFSRDHLHRPSDDLKLPINYEVAAKFASVYQLITQRVADSAAAPRWYAGDDFGERFAPQAPKATRKSGASK